jgi:hypothetical protein
MARPSCLLDRECNEFDLCDCHQFFGNGKQIGTGLALDDIDKLDEGGR